MEDSQHSPSTTDPSSGNKGRSILWMGIASAFLVPVFLLIVNIYPVLFGSQMNEDFVLTGLPLLILVAPVLGTFAWVMGGKQLKRMRDGVIPVSSEKATKIGKTLGIVGASLHSVIIILVAILWPYLPSKSVGADRDSMISDMWHVSAHAVQYRVQVGRDSYSGYAIPDTLSRTESGSYTATVVHADTILLFGRSLEDSDRTITIRIDSKGKWVGSFVFEGDFRQE